MLQQITHLAPVLLLISTLSCCQLLPAGAQNIGEQDFELELAGGAQTNQFVEQPEPSGRFRRQINYPQLFAPQQQQQPAQQQPNPLSFLSELSNQMEGVRTVSSLFNQATGQQPQQQAAGPLGGLGGLANGAQLIGQLSELMRATQERSAKAASDGQQSIQAAGQQSLQAAQGGLQSAQGGIQSAITELGSGLQRLVTNNPNLGKDVKDLYQSVSSRLSSASNTIGQSVGGSSLNGPIVPATNAEQLADNLAKVALKPQPNV